MAKSFPYEKAALVLAVGKYFNRQKACDMHKVNLNTYDSWVQRLKIDEHLQELYTQQLENLSSEWIGNVTKALNLTLGVLETALAKTPFDKLDMKNPKDRATWVSGVKALALVIKNIGDLTVSGVVLEEEDIDDDEETEDRRGL